MNKLYGLCLVALAAPFMAQQVPGAIKPPPPPLAGFGQPAPPGIPAPASPAQPSGEEIGRLLRAQTEALRALSGRLEQLERRIERLERGGR